MGCKLGRVLGVLASYLGLGSSVPATHVPGHLTSTCNKGIKQEQRQFSAQE